MSRFLGCGCQRRPQAELQPAIWAGRHNSWVPVPEVRWKLATCSALESLRRGCCIEGTAIVSRDLTEFRHVNEATLVQLCLSSISDL